MLMCAVQFVYSHLYRRRRRRLLVSPLRDTQLVRIKAVVCQLCHRGGRCGCSAEADRDPTERYPALGLDELLDFNLV